MDKSQADASADGGADAGAVVALIGDLVSSRQSADRAGLQRAVGEALAAVEAQLPAVQPLEVTIGDEFQAVYATVADAARAALLLRLRLLPVTDTRYGLGRGSLTVFDRSRTPFSQDGPAWWAARAAIDTARERSLAPRTRTVRTWFAAPPAGAGPGEDPAGAVNAFLVCRDDIVGRMNARSQRLLALLLAGQQQEAMAHAEGVSQSAVSQALSRSGAYAVLRAGELLATSMWEGPVTFVAAVLLGLGLVDLVRWSPEAASVRREVVALVVGAVVLVALAVSVGAGAGSATALAAVGIGASAVWVVCDTAPLRRGGRTPLAVLVAVAVVLVVLLPAAPPIAGPLQRWYLASGGGGAPTRIGLREVVGGGVPAVQALTALAGVLFVLCSGNRVVRLVLACAGSPPASGEAALKGGRLLGPLERLFILGLALAGDLTAAAVVIAAKGVLRLPEIRTAREERRGGADTVTEYFLVGTFTSWLLAVGVAALVVLAG